MHARRSTGWAPPARRSSAELELSAIDDAGAADVALGLVLPCWTLLGMLDRAIELTIAHVSLRKQFGQPLSSFQGVQFQLTDAEVERSGVDILAKYALWSVGAGAPEALDDALALRMSAIEAAEIVFRVCHQLHGAVGFCDETTLSWLSRYSQPLRRLAAGPVGDARRIDPPGRPKRLDGTVRMKVAVIGTGFGKHAAARRTRPGFRRRGRSARAMTPRCRRRSRPTSTWSPCTHRRSCIVDHVTAAIEHGHAVLCDKPFGRNAAEAEAMRDRARTPVSSAS